MLVFTAHFTHTPVDVIMEMKVPELIYWYKEALSLYNEMNTVKDG